MKETKQIQCPETQCGIGPTIRPTRKQSVHDKSTQGQSPQGQSQKGGTQRAVHSYLENLNGHEATTTDLYDLVISETEKGLLTEVLDWCEGNQSKAAVLLGITRTTLRNKIRKLGL